MVMLMTGMTHCAILFHLQEKVNFTGEVKTKEQTQLLYTILFIIMTIVCHKTKTANNSQRNVQ